VGTRSGGSFVEIFMSDGFCVNLELRDRYCDVGHHLLVQDAPSFIQKYTIVIFLGSLLAFVYVSDKCMFFIDFHVLALSGSSRAHHDVRLEKNSTDSPDFEFSYRNLMPIIYGQIFVLWKTDYAPRHFLEQP
jgi:hypothetical protein